ncbi:phosphotransferase enzyme family protein [Peribacillus sp. SCS-155]|uniref:phosphotransferase enzyme family protein n=1 Tax=Peribacillus sedimenti TaxID=3115297 RepID=UPI0039064B1D
MPRRIMERRPTWESKLIACKSFCEEELVKREYEILQEWANTLPKNPDNYGLIHFDAELDNICSNKGELTLIDFDDCMVHWFAADIAFALRDLFGDQVNLRHPNFLAFIKGYERENKVLKEDLQNIPMFLRMHELLIYAQVVRCLDLERSTEHPEWLNRLIDKLSIRIQTYKRTLKNKQNIGI